MGKTIRFAENSLIAIKKKLNEIMAGSDDIVSHNDVSAVKLYHGTTIDALLMIMESGVMSAKRGKQHGETHGVNWFSLENGDNFNRGALFSIEVPGDVFNERFRMMNNSEVVSKDDDLDVTSFNLTIEKICGLSREAIKNAYNKYVGKGDRYPLESTGYLFDHFIERVQDDDVLFPSILYHNWDKYYPMIMKNILGDNINESVAKEFAPVTEIGMEAGGGPGKYAHMVQDEKSTEDVNESREDSLQLAIKFRPDKYNRWAVIFPSRPGLMPQFFEKVKLAKEFKSWYRGDCEIVDLDKLGSLTEGIKYDHLFSIYNTNKNIPDYDEAILYFKNIESQLSKEMNDICNKYGCKRIFFIASINQGYLQVNPNDLERFKELANKCLETNKKIENLERKKESIIQNIEREKESAKRREVDRKEQEENDRIFSLVIDEYGTTTRVEIAEYILPDGTMLCSGGDHRGIAGVYDVNNISIFDDTYRYNYVIDFLNRGAIRCRMLKTGSILDMTKEPTDKQYSLLKTFVRYAGGTVDIDFTDSKGDTSYSVSYSNANPQQVVADIYKYYNEGIKPQGNVQFESKSKKVIIPEDKLVAIMENMEKEVESSEVDLSSFKKRDTLPPGIWKDEETLNSRVRLKLLDIADDFWEFVNLSWVEPKGIIITGSICNFNWSKFSDIDLHLIVDFNEIDEKTEFVKQYLDSKKNEWNTEHEGLKIMGFPVELYVQDINDDIEAGGIYDLEENAWVRKPNPRTIKNIGLEKFNIKDKAAEIMTIIDEMYDTLSSTDDEYEVSKIGEDAHYLWDKVKGLRKKSLTKSGENGAGNIVYKVLRRTGYLDKLFKLFSATYDKSNSITEGINLVTESKEILNEFLDSNYGMSLYKYFKWAEKASDREKVEDLFYHCPYIIGEYLDDISRYDEELGELEEELLNNRDLEYDDEYIERVLDALEKHKLLKKLLDYPYSYASAEELPSWFVMNFIRVVKNEWCIHFTSDAYNIARKGFTGGTPEIEDLAYTNAGREKHYAGYDFAFLINDRSVDFNGYGDEAVIFRASGVLLLHYGDEQRQVVFWGPSVKELIPIKKEEYSYDWKIEGLNGQVFATGKPSELADWATDNLPQYRNQILAGKSGYRPWGYSRPAFDNEFMKLPLNNESVKKYLTLLKEEVAMDGSSEGNPYEKRWKAERDALKNFVANYGKLMQSKEDDKGGKLYKVYFDKTMSDLIGYNYCICVQWNEQEMKPGSTVYIRALDKFTPFIRRNLQFDTRGRDNMRGTYDDTGY